MKVKFVPQNVEFEIKSGQSVMHAAQDNGLYVKSVCKGVPSCAECRVRIVDGDFNVLPPGPEELALIGTGHFIDHRRLSCQLKCFGDITVDMTEQTQKQAGLIGGRKTKAKIQKDDRVEDAHAIRVSDRSATDSPEDEEGRASAPRGRPDDRSPRGNREPRPPRKDQQTKGGGTRGPSAQPNKNPNRPSKSGPPTKKDSNRDRTGGATPGLDPRMTGQTPGEVNGEALASDLESVPSLHAAANSPPEPATHHIRDESDAGGDTPSGGDRPQGAGGGGRRRRRRRK